MSNSKVLQAFVHNSISFFLAPPGLTSTTCPPAESREVFALTGERFREVKQSTDGHNNLGLTWFFSIIIKFILRFPTHFFPKVLMVVMMFQRIQV